jgi:hypothetical protein
MSFEFVSFHLGQSGTVTGAWIPLCLSLSIAAGVLASLLLGRLFAGLLYARARGAVVAFSVAVQLALLPLLVAAGRAERARS